MTSANPISIAVKSMEHEVADLKRDRQCQPRSLEYERSFRKAGRENKADREQSKDKDPFPYAREQ